MSYTEFIDHLADQQLEPWDASRSDLHAAQVVCTVANLHRRKGQRPYTITDCVLRFANTQPERHQAPAEVVRCLERFFDRLERHHLNHGHA